MHLSAVTYVFLSGLHFFLNCIVETLPTDMPKPRPFRNWHYFHKYVFNQNVEKSTPKAVAPKAVDSPAEETKCK